MKGSNSGFEHFGACCYLMSMVACPFVAHISYRTIPCLQVVCPERLKGSVKGPQMAIPVRFCMYNGNKELAAPRTKSRGNHHRPSNISSSVKSSLSSSPLSSSSSSSICSSSRLSPSRSKSRSSNVSSLLSPPNFPLPFTRD